MNKSCKRQKIPPSDNETHKYSMPIDADSTYRIGLCGFRIRGSRQLVRYLDEAVRAAFDGWNGKKLLLLSGRLKRKPWEHRDSWPPVDEIADVASERKLPILFQTIQPETRPFYTAVSDAGKKLPLKLYQQFSNSKNVTPEKVKRLVKECNRNEKRDVHIGGITLGLLICGENNVLANKQSDGNSVYVRYGCAPDLFRGFRIVLQRCPRQNGRMGKA